MNIVVLGSGESAIGAALLARNNNNEVFVSDLGYINQDTKQLFEKNNIRFEESGHSIEIIGKADLIVKSPGIPNSSALIKQLKSLKKEVIGEIEYGYRNCTSKIIGITGSNGKSTVTSMIYHVLESSGSSVSIGGNFGVSFCRLLVEDVADWYVLELSSFQLEDVTSFKPQIALMLNITPDHLDRYNYDINQYADAKFRISQKQDSNDVLILNADDKLVVDKASQIDAKTIAVAQNNAESVLASFVELNTLPYAGNHNYFNSLIAAEAAQLAGVEKDAAFLALKTYGGLPHRMEEVAIINGVRYINDSKATNVDAVYYAIEGIDGPLVWIVGGVDKGNDYSQLDGLVAEKVKHIVCMGTDNSKLMKHYGDKGISISDCKVFEEAIHKMIDVTEEGDTVLLSPACASFDLFDNYIHRGNIFKERIYKLIYNSYSCLQ